MCPRNEKPQDDKALAIGAYMFFQAGYQMTDCELDIACRGAMYMQEMKILRDLRKKQKPTVKK